jgi:photosynthetic reaction center cytochrome c subunit
MRNYNWACGRRKLLVSLSVAVLVSGLGARPTPPTSDSAKQAFKNVQVLKDIPADDLVPSMEFISSSLGVSCDFCHVRDAFEKDDKAPKKTARQMIQMVLALNAQNFEGKRAVTCYTCHRGGRAPISIPAIGTKMPSAWEEAYVGEVTPEDLRLKVSSDLPTVADILAKYVTAVGGRSAIAEIVSRMETGTVSFDGDPTFPVEVLSKLPDKRIFTIHMQSGDSSTIFDGVKGWLRSPGSPVHDMHHADLPGAKLDADLHFALNFESTFREFKAVTKTRIGASDCILVFATNPNQPPVELYFDSESGLLLRQVRFAASPLGLNPTQIDYDDYKEFDGVKVPTHLIITAPSRHFDIKFEQVKQNIALPDAKFERP